MGATFPDTAVHTRVIHLIRDTFRYAGRQRRDAIAKAVKPIYTAVNAEPAAEALDAFEAEWGNRYPPASRLWRRPEIPIRGHPITGPDRDRPEAMDDALETSTERVFC